MFYMYYEGCLFVAGTSADELLQFHAATFPETIVFESDKDLKAVESFYNAGFWESVILDSINHGGGQGYLCPRCGAVILDQRTHVEWHLNNEVARVPSSAPYVKGQPA